MPEKRKRVVERREIVVSLPVVKAPSWLQGFVDFVREQGVVGLAVGLVLGVAAKSVVDSLVNNIFNPVIGAITGGPDLASRFLCIRHDDFGNCVSKLGFGNVINSITSFMIVAAVVYFVVKGLKLDKIDKKKD